MASPDMRTRQHHRRPEPGVAAQGQKPDVVIMISYTSDESSMPDVQR